MTPRRLTGSGKRKEREALDGLLRATLPMIWHYVKLFSSPESWPRQRWDPWIYRWQELEKAYSEALKYIPRDEGAIIPFGDVGCVSIHVSAKTYGDQLACKFGKLVRTIVTIRTNTRA